MLTDQPAFTVVGQGCCVVFVCGFELVQQGLFGLVHIILIH